MRAAQGAPSEFHIAVQVWLTLAMSAILILPALLISSWFAGLYPVSPYRELSLDTGL